ncbi:MAG: hypothetical protein JO257_22265 [Deltaproteobacteria bacterium]|nr:hypothetical protein [Deltaproteobacteria bacterium]
MRLTWDDLLVRAAFGQVETIASSRGDFDAKMNDPIWQEAMLGSKLVYAMHDAGKRPGPHECYAVAPPPALTGLDPREAPVDPSNVQVMSIRVWHSICRQVLGGPA